jgi:hypothetical protein
VAERREAAAPAEIFECTPIASIPTLSNRNLAEISDYAHNARLKANFF